MNRTFLRRLLLAILVFSLTVPVIAGQQGSSPDRQAIIKKGAAAYYSLKNLGLTGFECVATPDWDKFLAENLKNDPPAETLVRKFKLVRGRVSISETGAPATTIFLTDGSQVDESMTQMTDGLEQMLNGYLQSWWPFVFENPLAELDATTEIKEEGSGYRIHQKQGASEVSILITKDSVMTVLEVVLPGGSVVIYPKFVSTGKGLLLSNLESDIKSQQQHVSITIDYQDVDGFKLPARAAYKVTSPTVNVSLDVTFSKYKISKG